MKLSVIILSFNTEKILRDCLDSLFIALKADKLIKETEIVVVDNASKDGSVAMVRRLFKKVRLIKNKKNIGFGAANNQAAEQTSGDYLLFLNSDTHVEKDNLRRLIGWLETHPRCGVVGPKLLNADGTDQPSTGRFPDLWTAFLMLFASRVGFSKRVRTAYDKTRSVDWVMGAAILFRRDVFDWAGGFDEQMFMYMEELELCFRVKKLGWRIDYLPSAKITHLGGASSGFRRTEPIWYIYQGLRYFYQKHYSVLAQVSLRFFLKLKAGLAYLFGRLTANNYLIKTYGKAYRLG